MEIFSILIEMYVTRVFEFIITLETVTLKFRQCI